MQGVTRSLRVSIRDHQLVLLLTGFLSGQFQFQVIGQEGDVPGWLHALWRVCSLR